MPDVSACVQGGRRDRLAVALSHLPLRPIPGTRVIYFEAKVTFTGDRPAINVGVARPDYPLDDVEVHSPAQRGAAACGG